VADAIFISYRRDDAEGEAGRLFDDLTRAFGNDAVFMDVAGIKPGVDFRKAIEDNVASCGVLLAVVGPTWASVTNADGKRRLEDPNDFVALEIGSALSRDVPVIPVLVHEAKMPAANLLPDTLKNFSYRNSVELSHARWNSDVQLLVEALKSYVKPAKSASPEPVHATVPVQLPAPHHSAGSSTEAAASGTSMPVKAGISIAAVLAIAVAVYFAIHKSPTNPTQSSIPVATQAGSPGVQPGAGATATPPVAADPPLAAGASGPAAQYLGTWKRQGSGGVDDALGMLVISSAPAGGLILHAYGKCQAPNCDWGQQPGVISGPNLVATFSPSPSGSDTKRTATVTAHLTPAGLDVLVQNLFENPAGTHTSSSHHVFPNAR
jgi:hypothetical protein